jgi:hypothetical protein
MEYRHDHDRAICVARPIRIKGGGIPASGILRRREDGMMMRYPILPIFAVGLFFTISARAGELQRPEWKGTMETKGGLTGKWSGRGRLSARSCLSGARLILRR